MNSYESIQKDVGTQIWLEREMVKREMLWNRTTGIEPWWL